MIGCNYCNGNITLLEVWDEVEDHEPDLEVTIQGDRLMLSDVNYGTYAQAISYCPNCGRKLGEKDD
ncbi:hypothetical protein EFE01_01160 [Latilactobacillus curvatus]|nr:hypothetical protein [Latilactobacillus curvatus]